MDAKMIGERLIALRGRKTQVEVCAATGIKPAALCNYEKGLRIPNDEAKMLLSNYYNVSIDSLFFLPETKQNV